MHNFLGFSLYLSTYTAQCSALRGLTGTGAPVFLSLHISEEFDDTYCRRAEAVCRELADRGFRIIADVSVKTLRQFGCSDLTDLARRLGLWALRIDYGFDIDEIEAMAEKMPIVLNASTVTEEDAARLVKTGGQIFAMHNFYPRPETGLDEELLKDTTERLQKAGLKVLSFIPGDTMLRGPVFEGLPTLEEHRNCIPSGAFVDLCVRFGMDGVFVADPGISERETARILRYCQEHVISIPAYLEPGYEYLYDKVFTCRVDSPKWLIRFQESRMYSCPGACVEPGNCVARDIGSITVDNKNYGRYSGEVQLIRQPLPADSRVNVAGRVPEKALLLLNCVKGGQKFTLVRPE